MPGSSKCARDRKGCCIQPLEASDWPNMERKLDKMDSRSELALILGQEGKTSLAVALTCQMFLGGYTCRA